MSDRARSVSQSLFNAMEDIAGDELAHKPLSLIIRTVQRNLDSHRLHTAWTLTSVFIFIAVNITACAM